MLKIVGIPPQLDKFFRSLKTCFHWEHFEYFRKLVLAVAVAFGSRNVSNLCRHIDEKGRPHRTCFNNFLNVCRWEPKAALRLKADEMLDRLGPQRGDVVELIVDDSRKEKRGRQMDAVAWRKLKAGLYARSLFRRRRKRGMFIRKASGRVRYKYVDAGRLKLNKVGEVHLVFSRTHIALESESAQGKQRKTARPSAADLQMRLRRIVCDEITEHLKELPDGNSVIKELRRLLIAA